MSDLFDNIKFEISQLGYKISVTQHYLGEQKIFRILFEDRRNPLVITQTKTWQGIIWTSIPQGRQAEAEEYGAMIEEYLKRK